MDEVETLRASEAYLVRRFGLGAVTVLPEGEAGDRDPKGRRDRARPGRPAFYFF